MNPAISKNDPPASDRDSLVAALEVAGCEVRGRSVVCAFHGDRNASGSIYEGEDGRWRYKCHGCEVHGDAADIEALHTGRPLAEVLKSKRADAPRRQVEDKPKRTFAALADLVATVRDVVAVYDYSPASLRVIRTAEKHFLQAQQQPDGRWSFGGVADPQPLYHGADLGNGPVIVTEGEKDADALRALGFAATTAPMGADTVGTPTEKDGKPGRADWAALAGREVIIWPDGDEPGQRHGDRLARIIGKVKPTSLRRVSEIAHKDAADLIAAHSEGARAAVEVVLAGAAPVEVEPAADAWPELIPLECGSAPHIDPAVVGGVLGDMAATVAASVEVPPELPLGVGLAVASSVVARHYHVEMLPGYVEPPVIWSAAVEQSGGRKTSTSLAMIGPVVEWESARQHGMKRTLATAQVRGETLKLRVRDLMAKASKLDGAQADAVLAEIEDAQMQMEDMPVPPRRVVQDVTAERMAAMLAEHSECLLMASDEGGLFDQFAGRYNATGSGPNLDVWLQSHAGSPVRVDRKSGVPVALDRPRLAVSLMPQPSLVAQLQAKDGFRGRGLLARFAWWMPRSKVGYRTFDGAPIDPAASLAWRNVLVSYLDRLDPGEGTAALRPAPEALSIWRAFVADVEPRQRPGCDLAHMRDWASKSTGLVARIAGVLHALSTAKPEHAAIDAATMAKAVALVRLLIEHAKAAFATMKADPALEVAESIWSVVAASDVRPVRRHDVYRALRGSYSDEDLSPGWSVLLARGYVRQMPAPKSKGRPVVAYEVNPAAETFGHFSHHLQESFLSISLSPTPPDPLSATHGQNGQKSQALELAADLTEALV